MNQHNVVEFIDHGYELRQFYYILHKDLSLNDTNYFYFNFNDEDEDNRATFDGLGNTITIINVENFNGLFRNGSFNSNGNSNITIKNINIVISGSTTLVGEGGWLCQSYFGKGASNINVINCSVNGTLIHDFCGGLFGYRSDSIKATNCSFTGDITAGYGIGGIFGSYAGNNSEAKNCSFTGNIAGSNAGGIFGWGAGNHGTAASAINCYMKGDITGDGAGGIYGSNEQGSGSGAGSGAGSQNLVTDQFMVWF